VIAALTIAACTWADPGVDRFTGSVPAAVEAYADIPAPVRAKLATRLQRRQFDEVASIRRDSIEGKAASYTDLRGMHFGTGRVCATVDRSAWPADRVERGMVYCEGEHCLIVPTVCGNVSRVTRQPRQAGVLAFEAPGAGGGGAVAALAPIPPVDLGRALGLSEPVPALVAVAAPEPVQAAPLVRLEPAPWVPPPAPLIQPWAGIPPAPPIPEPGTWLLMLAGLGVMALRRAKLAAMGCLFIAIWAAAKRLQLWEFGE